ncbi:alpha-mannosidase [Mycobacteroides abscessus subsp. abscessus]|nr:alpha-mannosidase [Mycobacteroides abscessus]MBN7442342.1 alpha-mannosidase [Mycobacteroides abscessus subsp. abscessus]
MGAMPYEHYEHYEHTVEVLAPLREITDPYQ